MTLPSPWRAIKSKLAATVAVPLLALGLTLPAQAFPALNLDSAGVNDIYSPLLWVDYTYDLSANIANLDVDSRIIGAPGNLRYADGSFQPIELLNFTLDATLDHGNQTAVGNFSIFGDVDMSGTSQTLLSGTLSMFGTTGGVSDPLEFIFDVDPSSHFSGLFGPLVGVILDGFGFPGNLLTSFSGTGQADTFTHAVPEPALMVVCLLGLGLLSVGRRRT